MRDLAHPPLIKKRQLKNLGPSAGLKDTKEAKLKLVLRPKGFPLLELAWRWNVELPMNANAVGAADWAREALQRLGLSLQLAACDARERSVAHECDKQSSKV